MSKRHKRISRRQLLRGLAATTMGGALGAGAWRWAGRASAAPGRQGTNRDHKPAKFLIVIGGLGGASIVDSFMPITHSECPSYQTINSYYPAEVVTFPDSQLRALDRSGTSVGSLGFSWDSQLSAFVSSHKERMLVATTTGTSVNHFVAQQRSLTGNNAWGGRTLQEAVAFEYGHDFPVPNVNMGAMGFLEAGADKSLPSYVYGEAVAQPELWSFSLDSNRGIRGAPDRELIELARTMRDSQLDRNTGFYETFRNSPRLERWLEQREAQPALESMELINKLIMLTESAEYPFGEYGLQPSEDAALLESVFPMMQVDALEAQAALAFLLLKNRVSVTVTISPTFNLLLSPDVELINPPLAFDNSHNAHQDTQAVMWSRVMGVADRLIRLLQQVEFDASTGESMWDRTLLYIATDFGRTRRRASETVDFNSGHDLNNGVVILSDMVKGNSVFGNVDPETGLTYGWDPVTGEDLDKTQYNPESHIYAGILRALDVDTTGSPLPTVAAWDK